MENRITGAQLDMRMREMFRMGTGGERERGKWGGGEGGGGRGEEGRRGGGRGEGGGGEEGKEESRKRWEKGREGDTHTHTHTQGHKLLL